jgi:hypothetical protein
MSVKTAMLIAGLAGCCARTESGHATAAPLTSVMNSRRLIAAPRLNTNHRTAVTCPLEGVARHAMSALGHKRTFAAQNRMSALPLIATAKADICVSNRHVRFTPESGHVRCTSPCPLWAKSGHRPLARTNVSFSGPHHQKSGKNTGVLQDLRQMSGYVTCGVNVRSHLEKTRSPRDRSGDHHTVRSVPVVGR